MTVLETVARAIVNLVVLGILIVSTRGADYLIKHIEPADSYVGPVLSISEKVMIWILVAGQGFESVVSLVRGISRKNNKSEIKGETK